MYPDTYFVDKETGTPADTLAAFGLARLLVELLPEEHEISLTIEDAGDSYRIALDEPIAEEWVTQHSFFMLMRGLDTGSQQPALPETHVIDYQHHRERNAIYFEAREDGFSDEELREQNIAPPAPQWPAWAIINQMFAIYAYNELAEAWYAHREVFPHLVDIVLTLYSGRPNALDQAESAWKKLKKKHNLDVKRRAKQLQVVNPGMGKGGNRTKADGLSIGGMKAFWLPEYLKYVGFFEAALPRTARKTGDRKTYIVRPRALTWDTHRAVFPRFRDTLYSQTAIKMDVLATLRYCQTFLRQWIEGQASGRFKFIGGQPGDHVEAIEVIHYKDMGSAYATMNVSSLVLPTWLPVIETDEQAKQFVALLEEHEGVIRSLEEDRGRGYELLRRYRDFLSARTLDDFYAFTRGYARHVMSALAGDGYRPRQFVTDNLEVLLMSHDKNLAPILQNEGFRNVAEAIRRSTVVPQYRKARNQDPFYTIRYGLGDKLLRRSQYGDKFVQELSQFMHDYNKENARKSETRGQQYRSNITVADIESIVALIDNYDAPTIANLLIAFGYARDPAMTGSDETAGGGEQQAGTTTAE